jgi:hypothetical protein
MCMKLSRNNSCLFAFVVYMNGQKVVQTARSHQHFAHDKNGGRFSILIF